MLDEMVKAPVPGVIENLFAEGEAGVLEAPADEGLGDTGAGDADAGAGDAGDGSAEDLDQGDGSGEGDGGAEGAAGEQLGGAKLWNAVKESLKDLDPKLRGSINRAIHKLEGIEKKFPDGIEKVTATLEAVKQLAEDPAAPTEKVIADTLSERQYFRELDQAFTEARPEFVAKMAEASPASFDKLAPQFFNKYFETNPDGAAGYVARTVVQHMDQADVPLHFKVLATFLPQLADGPVKDKVIEAVEGIYGWNQALKAMAAKQPAAKADAGKGDGKDDMATREQQLAERETMVTLQTWNTEALQPGIRAVYSEADKIAGKQKLSGDERKKVLAKVGEELDIRLAANKGYGEAMRGYLKAGNKQAFIQRLESERKKLIPGAVRRAVDDVVAERPAKAKPGAQKGAADAGGKKPGAAAAAADAGGVKTEWIAGHPSTQNLVVDLNRTTHAMLLKKQAYVKGRQTPVAWK